MQPQVRNSIHSGVKQEGGGGTAYPQPPLWKDLVKFAIRAYIYVDHKRGIWRNETTHITMGMDE